MPDAALGGFAERLQAAMGLDAASSGSDEVSHSDHAVIIDSESSDESEPDLWSDDSTSAFGELDRESETDDDNDASLLVNQGSVPGDFQILIDSDEDLDPLEHMHKRRRTTAAPRHTIYADDGAGPTYANLRCLEANLSTKRCVDPPTRRLRDKTVPETGLSPSEVYVLKSFCVPSMLWHILALLHWRGFGMGDIGGLE